MAVNRVLTSAERETLVANQDFKNQVSWALRNFASYWSIPANAAGQVGGIGFDRAAKNYAWAARTDANITISDDAQAPDYFGHLSKGMNLWDTAVNDDEMDIEVVIDYMVTNNKFEELAIMYVTSKTPTMVF